MKEREARFVAVRQNSRGIVKRIVKSIGTVIVTVRRVGMSAILVVEKNTIRTRRVNRRVVIAIIVRNAVKIVVGREIVKGKVRGIGAVKGTTRGSALGVTAGAITIGAVFPIADPAAITLPSCFPPIVRMMTGTEIADIVVISFSFIYLPFS